MSSLYEKTVAGCEQYPKKVRGTLKALGNGACWLGATFPEAQNLEQALLLAHSEFPYLRKGSVACPECGPVSGMTFSHVDTGIHLNDEHNWSREQISLYLSQFAPEAEKPASVEAEKELATA